MKLSSLLLVLVYSLTPCLLVSAEDASAINILLVLPEESPAAAAAARDELDLSQQLERAVLMATDSVNNNSDLYLKGKQLRILVQPSQVCYY